MAFKSPVGEIVRQRYSCRSYALKPIAEAERRGLSEFLEANTQGPFGTRARFSLVAATGQDAEALKGLGTYGFIKHPAGFIVGAVEESPGDMEDYGYLMEKAILAATDLGLGTCWLGGTFSKSSFAKKIGLRQGETVPAVAATGYPAESDKGKPDPGRRFPWPELFSRETFGNAMTPEQSGAYAEPLEMVRLAPSATNKQPWRIVRSGDAWHFYLKRTKGYGKGSLLFRLLRIADLQRVDLGIAMCHFELSAREFGLDGRWVVEEPDLGKPEEEVEYTVTWQQAG